MVGNRIASRYAKSLLDLSIERGSLDAVLADMHVLNATVDSSRELQLLLLSPIIKADKKNSILASLFKDKVGELTMSFMTLLTKKGREGVLSSVIKSFISQVQAYKGIVPAEVISAAPLDSVLLEKVTTLAKELAGKQIELHQEVNPELIGGFILTVGDKQVDQSVAGKIQSLKREFSQNPYVPGL